MPSNPWRPRQVRLKQVSVYQETVPSFRSHCKWSLPSYFPPLLLCSPQKSSKCEKPIVTMETVTVLVDDAQIIIFKCRSKHNSNKKNIGPLRLRYYIKVQTGNLEIPLPLYSESSQLGTDERN